MDKFIIIDGNAILHRAFHAMPPLTTSTGRLVNAVYGFASMLLKLQDGFRPGYMAVTFDLPKPTFRKKMFAEYQIKRPKMDEGLVGQIETVKEMVRVLGIPIYEKEGYEADDVIGTLAKQAAKIPITNIQHPNNSQNPNSNKPNISDKSMKNEQHRETEETENTDDNIETIIVTGDRDILQLVSENVKVYMPTKGITEAVLYDSEKVKERFGIPPELIPDYKGLVGDASDNYPGVGGIGPKTAEELLKKYGSFEEVYRNLEEVKGGVKEKLVAGREGGEMSHQLATIITDVPVDLDLESCKLKDFDRPEVVEFFDNLGFKSIIKRIQGTTLRQAQGKLGTTGTTSITGRKSKNHELRIKNQGELKDENQMSLF